MNNNKYIFSTCMGYVGYVVRVIMRVSLLNPITPPEGRLCKLSILFCRCVRISRPYNGY